MANGTTYQVQIAPTYGPNGIQNGISYGETYVFGTLTLQAPQLAISADLGSYTGNIVLIHNYESNAVSGTFYGLPEGADLRLDDRHYKITYKYNADTATENAGNDVALIDSGTYAALTATTTAVSVSTGTATAGCPVHDQCGGNAQ